MNLRFSSTHPLLGLAALCAPLLSACADAGSLGGDKDEAATGQGSATAGAEGGEEGGEGLGVGQGGAQDFGQFKQILEAGEIPGPNTIDDVGFFNEHKVELPTPKCANDVCIHGLFGQMGNMITGSDCITVLVGMNTAIDVAKLERPPLNLSLVIDTSGSMEGEPIAYVRDGLMRMLDGLESGDHISLITFSTGAKVQVEAVTGDAPELINAIDAINANGGTNIYDGLRTGFELVAAHAEDYAQNRVILLSDGNATEGITNDAKIVSMAAGYAAQGFGLTTIGVGAEFDVELMRTLSEQASGSFYFLEDPAAVKEVFHEEVTSFLVPLAEDVSLDVDIGDAYVLRGIYDAVDGSRYSIQLANTRYSILQEEKLLRVFLAQKPAGLIVTGIDQTPESRSLMEATDCPVVQLMEIGDNPVDMMIGFSHADADRKSVV